MTRNGYRFTWDEMRRFSEWSKFRFSLDALRRAVSPASNPNEWSREIGAVADRIEALNRATEKDFLAVGGKLAGFINLSRGIHSQLEGLASLVSREGTQKLYDALCSVRNCAQDAQRRNARNAEAIATIRTEASRIRSGFSSFGKIAMSFRIAAIQARIETASLSKTQEDLGNLAVEVCSCSDTIEARANGVLDAAAAFDDRISRILKESCSLEEIQTRELPALLTVVDRDLEVIEERQRAASAASSRMGADMNSVRQHLGSLVTSIQFQDIIRQQLEHIVGALRDLTRGGEAAALNPSAASILTLQQMQLASAAASFSQSTQEVEFGLGTIEQTVNGMVSASKSILSDGESGSFFTQLEERLVAIVTAVRQLDSLERSQAQAIAELERISRELSTAVCEVQAIELQLSRIVINAMISASHIGAAGEPLNVVAGAIQALQSECASRSREAESAVSEIRSAIVTLASLHERALWSAGNLKSLASHAFALRAAGESSAAANSSVAFRAGSLCRGLSETRHDFTIGKEFADDVQGCVDAIARLASETKSAGFDAEAPADDRARRYTMQSERDVHRAAAGEAELTSVDSGDDIELF